jgi:hypothetical protein
MFTFQGYAKNGTWAVKWCTAAGMDLIICYSDILVNEWPVIASRSMISQ